MIEVAAVILTRRDERENDSRNGAEILICQRPEGSHCSLLWEFPGGKVEAEETPEACVVRECLEELNLQVRLKSVYAEFTYRYPDRKIAFTFFRGWVEAGEMVLRAHHDARWVRREELGTYEFCPADEAIVKKLQHT